MSTISRFRFKTRAGALFGLTRRLWTVAQTSVGPGLVAEGQGGRGEAAGFFLRKIDREEVAGRIVMADRFEMVKSGIRNGAREGQSCNKPI